MDFSYKDPTTKTAGEGILGPSYKIGNLEFNMIYNSYV